MKRTLPCRSATQDEVLGRLAAQTSPAYSAASRSSVADRARSFVGTRDSVEPDLGMPRPVPASGSDRRAGLGVRPAPSGLSHAATPGRVLRAARRLPGGSVESGSARAVVVVSRRRVRAPGVGQRSAERSLGSRGAADALGGGPRRHRPAHHRHEARRHAHVAGREASSRRRSLDPRVPQGPLPEYEDQIRREYSWVPEAAYRTARSRILREFQARPFIYHTRHFRDALEDRARVNLQSSIDSLAG